MTHHPLVFVDCETTGLDSTLHTAWEIAVIRRDGDGDTEHLWQIPLSEEDLAGAEPKALEINRYHQRAIAVHDPRYAAAALLPGPRWLADGQLEDELHAALGGATLVGSNPAFDARFLAVELGTEPDTTPWHYRTVDVATLAAGYLIGSGRGAEVSVPYSSRGLSRALGIEPPADGVAHTALGDARWVRDMWDALHTTQPRPAA